MGVNRQTQSFWNKVTARVIEDSEVLIVWMSFNGKESRPSEHFATAIKYYDWSLTNWQPNASIDFMIVFTPVILCTFKPQ